MLSLLLGFFDTLGTDGVLELLGRLELLNAEEDFCVGLRAGVPEASRASDFLLFSITPVWNWQRSNGKFTDFFVGVLFHPLVKSMLQHLPVIHNIIIAMHDQKFTLVHARISKKGFRHRRQGFIGDFLCIPIFPQITISEVRLWVGGDGGEGDGGENNGTWDEIEFKNPSLVSKTLV